MQTDYSHLSFSGVWEDIFNAGEDIYASPNSDVNLSCQTEENDFLVQMQWSKVTDQSDPIAVYHPQYGLYCSLGHACESQVTFMETLENVTKWTLYLRNISTTFSGKYECSFTLYPEGIQTRVYNLIVAPREYNLYKKGCLSVHVAFTHVANTQRQQPYSRFDVGRTET